MYTFGLNQSGQLGRTNNNPLSFDRPLKFLACGREHSHIVTGNKGTTEKKSCKNASHLSLPFTKIGYAFIDGTQLYSFGNNMYGQLGLGKNKNTAPGNLIAEDTPRLVDFQRIEHIACGLDNTILVTGGTKTMIWRKEEKRC